MPTKYQYVSTSPAPNPLVFLVKREGLRLTLSGRSERLSIAVPKCIPKALHAVFRDAMGAAAENDLSAGFYHLRTFVEHYMKACLSVPVVERVSGEDRGAKYNASLDARMSAGLPSMPSLYERSSKFMHERSGAERSGAELMQTFPSSWLTLKGIFLPKNSFSDIAARGKPTPSSKRSEPLADPAHVSRAAGPSQWVQRLTGSTTVCANPGR